MGGVTWRSEMATQDNVGLNDVEDGANEGAILKVELAGR